MSQAPNPWDRPDRKLQPLNPTPVAPGIFMAVGNALTTWSAVENNLALLFADLFYPESDYAAYRLFGSMPSTNSRLSAMRTSAEARFSEDIERYEYLSSLIALADKFLPRRNDFAHGICSQVPGGYILSQPTFNTRHKDVVTKKEAFNFNADEIMEYSANFHSLVVETGVASMLLGHYRIPFGSLTQTTLSKYVEPQKTALLNKLINNDDRRLAPPSFK